MSSYKSVAVVGAGRLGTLILSALTATEKISVILLSRLGSSKTAPPGVLVVPVDYMDVNAVSSVFKEHKVEVVLSTLHCVPSLRRQGSADVISAHVSRGRPTSQALPTRPRNAVLGHDGIGMQKSLADAAKLAAVKLFVPSEFGSPTHGHTVEAYKAKNEIAAHLKSLGIPFTRIYTGCFMEFLPFIASYADGKITIIGKGDAPISYTSLTDVAGFVAYVLTAVPSAQLENRILRLEGDRASWNDVAKLFKASVERVESFTGKDGEMRTGLLTLFETGAGSTGWDEPNKKEGSGSEAAGSANDLWPGHHWQTIKEVHSL
ncbi:hypothetical protein K438DRAFT_1750355 [Mycena galopus ATCC 62051]|nr:hypothetical protein K438DRAFT_1750355 [Mycena galopus ATCC 62051]